MEDKLLNEIVQRLVAIEIKLESLITLKTDVDNIKKELIVLQEKDIQQERDIKELRDNNRWLSRAIVGACITAAVGLVLVLVKIGLGINP